MLLWVKKDLQLRSLHPAAPAGKLTPSPQPTLDTPYELGGARQLMLELRLLCESGTRAEKPSSVLGGDAEAGKLLLTSVNDLACLTVTQLWGDEQWFPIKNRLRMEVKRQQGLNGETGTQRLLFKDIQLERASIPCSECGDWKC